MAAVTSAWPFPPAKHGIGKQAKMSSETTVHKQKLL